MKTALILHGWPQYEINKHFLVQHLVKKGYRVIAPNMFTSNYVFSAENIYRSVLSRLGNKKLNVIVGISLGGLIAPNIAKSYPTAKLVFIGSGSKLKSESLGFNLVLKIAKYILGFKVSKLLLKLPDFIITFFYKLANPFKGDASRKKQYEQDTATNIKFIKTIPLKKEVEIIDFVSRTDNTDLLKNLKNRSLIFNGKNDLLMTVKGGEELQKLLPNSELIVSRGSHFDSFTEEHLSKMDEFLELN